MPTMSKAKAAAVTDHKAEKDTAHAPVQLHGRSRLTLERVLGITALSNAMITVNPTTGELAYAAGCIVVIYNLRRNKQVRYYRVEKMVSCLCFSPNGQFLAIGEKGYMPSITIWNGTDGTLCAELQRHRYGIASIAFSRDGKYLVSVGLVHDRHLFAWDLTRALHRHQHEEVPHSTTVKCIGAAEIQEKVFAMDYCLEGNFFVTVGEKHFKFWFLDSSDQFLTTGTTIDEVPVLQCRDAVMSAKVSDTFMSVACGHGVCRLKTFAVTADGTLCCFGASGIMERLVSLEASCGYALSVTEAYVAVGGTSSITRLFDPATLEYRATLPFPPAFGTANDPMESKANALVPDPLHRYPAVVGVRISGSHVIVLYSDRALFIFDIADVQQPSVFRSFLFHSGSIRDLQIAGKPRGLNDKGKIVYDLDALRTRRDAAKDAILPCGTIITCSDDNTVRLWHLDLHKPTKSSRFEEDSTQDQLWKNPFSQEMLRVLYHNTEDEFLDPQAIVLGGTSLSNHVPDIHSPSRDVGPVNGLRALAIHSDGSQLATGDKEGNVTVFQLPQGTIRAAISAHTSEVHCIAFSDQEEPGDTQYLMASGGRDRLVQVYDSNQSYSVLSTLENHSGAVTSLHFANEGQKLVSSGADKTIVLSDVHDGGKVARYNSIPFTGGKIFDTAVAPQGDTLAALCNNRLDLYHISTGKHIKTHHVGEQHRLAICPSGFCVAMSGSLSDKTIHLVELHSGETLAEATGHGEAISGLRFTPDCRRLVSTSNDGCLFVWRLADELQSAIKARLPRVVEKPIAPPSVPQVTKAPSTTPAVSASPTPVIMPPPAPPVAPPRPSKPSVPLAPEPTTPPKAANAKPAPKEPPSPPPAQEASAAKEKPTGWKGKAKAVPGPMGNIPMADWMKTRPSAKKTVHVLDEDHDEEEEEDEDDDEIREIMAATAAPVSPKLKIDRSQTPDWARTMLPGESKAHKVVSDTERRSSAGGKWAKRADASIALPVKQELDDRTDEEEEQAQLPAEQEVEDQSEEEQAVEVRSGAHVQAEESDESDQSDQEQELESEGETLYIRQSTGELHQLEIPRSREVRSSRRSVETSAVVQQSLTTLSISHVDLSSSTTGSAGSLAQERELLEKKKKQMETANAVAAMNSKLAQLGLLKPKATATSPKPLKTDNDQSAPSSSGTATEAPTASSAPTEREEPKSELMEETNKSKEVLNPVVQLEEELKRRRESRDDIPEEMLLSIDAPLDEVIEQAMQEIDGDHETPKTEQEVQTTEAPRPTITASIDLTDTRQSMSAFTDGFATAMTSAVMQSTTRVEASLSAFTAGYRDQPEVGTSISKLPDVQASLSSFTTGFAVKDPVNASVNRLVDTTAVASSISAFTSGYAAAAATAKETGVTESLSAFTTGYALPKDAEHVRESIDVRRVDESLSTFTAGYTAKAPQEHQTEPVQRVDESLSQFTSGYAATTASAPVINSTHEEQTTEENAANESATPVAAPDVPVQLSIVTIISTLDQQLESTRKNLDALIASMDVENDELRAIQATMEQLRQQIQHFASKRPTRPTEL